MATAIPTAHHHNILWEQMHNPDFKGNEFVTFKMQAGLNGFNVMNGIAKCDALAVTD
jgi:hypothetical protein